MNRRRFIKTGLLFVPTIFACNQGVARLGNLEPEVGNWMARVRATTGNYTGKSVVCNDWMMKALKSAGLRSSIVRMGTFTGIGVNALKAPLIQDVGSGLPDEPNPFGFPLDEADFSEGVGVTGDGIREMMLSSCKQSDLYALDPTNHSFTYGIYVCVGANQSGFGMAIYNGSDYIYLYVSNGAGTSFFSTGISANQISVADANGTGFYCGSYNSTTDAKLYKRGVEIGSTATPGATFDSVYWVGVLGGNNQNTIDVAPSNKTFGGYMCGRGIAGADQPELNYIWQRGMTILGRAAA